MPKITVDGRVIECKDRQMILQACQAAGVQLPSYCYHDGLSIPASCRICLVEVEGIPKLVPSCQTPVRDGMVVFSKSTKAIMNQKQVMEYLLINHPLDCPVCDQAGECFLQDYSYEYGRSESRFEEDKAKKPKKDVGENIYLYSDRCIMCTRCVRFTREVSGTSELFVEGRGYREEIDIFPGKPCNNKLAGNVVDLCPVGALLDKDFLFKQRVWLLKQAASISPTDSGGENIYLEYNEGVVYRIKPRFNEAVNTWWISDDTRYSYKIIQHPKRLKRAMKKEHGSLSPCSAEEARDAAVMGLKVAKGGPGSLYAVLSPMMACEEAWLLGRAIRAIDQEALLVLGPVPTTEDEVFKHSITGQQTFVIKGEKVPNAAGIRRVLAMIGGPTATWEEFSRADAGKFKGGWIVGGYLSNWVTGDLPAVLSGGFKVVQDLLPTALSESADVVLPAAAWAEKDGCWENYAGKIQPFVSAVAPPEGVLREGDVYQSMLVSSGGKAGLYKASAVRAEMGEPFAGVTIPVDQKDVPAMEFAEL
jgi:NADH-quinone oxidoreductase subunit G